MARRFHDDQNFAANQPCELATGPSHHIARVLRMGAGDEIVVFNGRGGQWQAVIEEVHNKKVRVRPLHFQADDHGPALPVHLGLPMIKGERMDYALQKATELGVASISLIEFARNEVRLDAQRRERKLQRWQGVVIGACEQCGLNRIPPVRGPRSLAAFQQDVAHTDLKLIADAGGGAVEASALQQAQSLALITGPEGGFHEDENRACLEAGFQRLALGTRVLRAETAPVALLASLYSLAGGW